MLDYTLGLIGAGNMGQAIVRGALKAGVLSADKVIVSDQRQMPLDQMAADSGVSVTDDNRALIEAADVVLLAIKPQGCPDFFSQTRGTWKPTGRVLSVVAGVTTSSIEDAMGVDAAVVRVMPNTPALVGQGLSAFCLGRFASDSDGALTSALFSSVGQVVQVDESLMDPVTATSGSGPAYVFLLAEAMEAGAISLGMSPEVARMSVAQTLLGAATLMARSDEPPSVLRKRVTSPGGTTAAALATLKDGGFDDLMTAAMTAACRRAEELGNS